DQLGAPATRRDGDPDPGALDVDEDRHERMFQRVVQLVERLLAQEIGERAGQLEGEVRPLAGEVERRVDWQRRERQRLHAAAADVFLTERLVARVLERELLERMTRSGRL